MSFATRNRYFLSIFFLFKISLMLSSADAADYKITYDSEVALSTEQKPKFEGHLRSYFNQSWSSRISFYAADSGETESKLVENHESRFGTIVNLEIIKFLDARIDIVLTTSKKAKFSLIFSLEHPEGKFYQNAILNLLPINKPAVDLYFVNTVSMPEIIDRPDLRLDPFIQKAQDILRQDIEHFLQKIWRGKKLTIQSINLSGIQELDLGFNWDPNILQNESDTIYEFVALLSNKMFFTFKVSKKQLQNPSAENSKPVFILQGVVHSTSCFKLF